MYLDQKRKIICKAVKEENRVKKAIEKIKWQSRTRIKPLRKVKDESGD